VTSEYSEPCDEYFYALNNLELLWYHAPKEKLDKIGQPSLVLGLELLIFRSWQAKRATY
jgi:hypothetical protein